MNKTLLSQPHTSMLGSYHGRVTLVIRGEEVGSSVVYVKHVLYMTKHYSPPGIEYLWIK